MRKNLPKFYHRILGATLMAAALGSVSAYADSVYVSYGVKNDDPVYPYTGFSVNEDVDEFNIAVKFTADMLNPYAGAEIKKVHMGWSGIYQDFTPTAKVFIRKGLNGEDITSGEISMEGQDGWNVVEFDTPYTIEENTEIVVGYTVEMWEGVYGPCTIMWGEFPEGTHFISRNDYTDADGNPEWIDLLTPGMMDAPYPVMIVLEVEVNGDDFDNRGAISKIAFPSMLLADTETAGGIKITNTGSNEINSVTLSYAQEGTEVYSKKYDLSYPIEVGKDAVCYVPVYASAKGEVNVCLSEINGVPVSDPEQVSYSPIVVPADIAGKFTRRPLVEYFASESEYRSYAYDSEIVTPNLDSYRNRISRIDWHVMDQFQLGLADDKDYALDMLVDVADHDYSIIYLPTLMLDRNMNLGIDIYYSVDYISSPMIGILYSPAAETSYEYALAQPTFADLAVSAQLSDDVITVGVTGNADLSVLPEGEELMLTVVLVEDGIETDSQEMPGGTGDAPNPGHAVHNNMVRQVLTEMWGNPVKVTDGKFNETFTTYIDFDNIPDNMRAVAFLNRSKDNGMWQRNVINSAEGVLVTTSVRQSFADKETLRPVLSNGNLRAPEGASLQVFTASGIPVSPSGLNAGIYLVKVTGANGNSAAFKISVP